MMEPAERKPTVGVIGGGIAGVGAAWSLRRAGYKALLFEKGPALGGNARTFAWRVGDKTVESPLLVVAWPKRYYHNYKALLDELGIGTRPIPISYFVQSPDGVFAQDGATDLQRRFAPQFKRWDRLLRFISWVNDRFLPRERGDSLYHSSYFNPMNLVPLYWLARLFGISRKFWEIVFVGVHCASFITTKMKHIPAVIGPLLESIVPLEQPCEMETWATAPREVFDRMTADFADDVFTGHRIIRVQRNGSGFTIQDAEGRSYDVDKVIFACDSKSALDALETPTGLQKTLLGGVQYIDDVDTTFSEFLIHSDASVLPEEHRDRILSDFNTYSEFKDDGSLECTFVLSSKYPGLNEHGLPMLVTFNSDKEISQVQRRVELPRASHTVGLRNLTIMSLIRTLQGTNDLYYCGSFTTPEGGHDLSFLSGLVAANLIGAPYPFPRDNALGVADFERMQRLMLGAASRGRSDRKTRNSETAHNVPTH